ncbi:UDP-GalNAc:beta-1,3-N-acetylgalactosaminyltransferase 1-like isoform X3 [Oculina patagonica]
MGNTMNRYCTIRHLLMLASLTGLLNLVYLMFLADIKGNLELYTLRRSSSSVLRRQIASIQVDSDVKSAGPSLSYLEVLNLDLKELVQRYMASSETVAKQYDLENLQGGHQQEQKLVNRFTMPRCLPAPFLLIMVHSSPANFMDRESIRLSWGREDNPINQGSWTSPERSWKTVFLVGQTNNSKLNNLLRQEAQIHKDIVIGDFLDTYRNLSLKTLLGFQWSWRHCRPKYILKTDEDCYVNVLSLVQWLQDYHVANGSKPLYAGNIQRDMEVVRDKNHRYYVSVMDMNKHKYPPYASGGGYVFSASLLPKLLTASRQVPIIPVEDACVGLYMQYIGIKPMHNTRILPFVYCDNKEMSLNERPICQLRDPLVLHNVRDILQIQTHYNVLLMTFIPTICSYVENQSFSRHYQQSC